MEGRNRHIRAYAFFSGLLTPFIKLKFHYTFDSLKGISGPYLLLCNHNMEMDPVLLGITAGEPVYYVASEHIMRKGFGTWFLMRYFRPIIHTKGKMGLQTSMEILRTLKDGGCVGMFPEGNRSFNGLTGDLYGVPGKLIRRAGAKLITYRMEGGYFTQPRWSTTLRRGKLTGRLIHIYEPEELQTMTDADVEAAIRRDLYEDAYATQQREKVRFRGRHLALGMESTLFYCPRCHRIGTLSTDDNSISCTCGMTARYLPTGDLAEPDGTRRTITDWDARQRKALTRLAAGDGTEPLFSDDVTVQEISTDHASGEKRPLRLTAFRDRLQLGDAELPLEQLQGAAVFSRNVLTLHTDKQFEVRGSIAFNALKYLYLIQYR